jgi:hypothetical protein
MGRSPAATLLLPADRWRSEKNNVKLNKYDAMRYGLYALTAVLVLVGLVIEFLVSTIAAVIMAQEPEWVPARVWHWLEALGGFHDFQLWVLLVWSLSLAALQLLLDAIRSRKRKAAARDRASPFG